MTSRPAASVEPTHAPKSREFRHDVNGVRALAVMSVVFYHFDVPGFGGGFVGVDVFFVISGFLMTKILASYEKDAPIAALVKFYMQRVRRILPALLILLIVLLGAGWLILPPSEYDRLASQVITSIFFVSNFQLWKTSGYFDGAAHDNWLLHTWSLSVEWQFYMLLPIFYVSLFRLTRGRSAVAKGCAVALALSLISCLIGAGVRPAAAFYLLPTRAWEMLAGSLVFFWAERIRWTPGRRATLAGLGLVAILFAVAEFDAWDGWPGWRAIVPVVGTMAILASNPRPVLADNWPVERLGLYSYSLYLWHWPVFVLLSFKDPHISVFQLLEGLSASLALGAISYHLIERPSQQAFSQSPALALKGTGLIAVASVVGGAAVMAHSGVPGRVDPVIAQTSQLSLERPLRSNCLLQEGIETPSCIYGGSTIKAVMIGDSHANGAMPALETAARTHPDAGIMEWTYAGCPPVQGVKYQSPGYEGSRCSEFVERVLVKIDVLPADVAVIFMARTSSYLKGHNEGGRRLDERPLIYFDQKSRDAQTFADEFTRRFVETACRVSRRHKLYLILPTPEMPLNVPKTRARALMLGESPDYSISMEDYNNRNDVVIRAEQAAAEQCGATLLDPTPFLCRDGLCPASLKGKLIYRDSNHLNREGNKLLAPMFQRVLQ